MENKVNDIREEILNEEYWKWVEEKGISSIYPKEFPAAYKEGAIRAIDRYMERTCLELLEYMAKKIKWNVRDRSGNLLFWDGKEYLTKEQVFKNFL